MSLTVTAETEGKTQDERMKILSFESPSRLKINKTQDWEWISVVEHLPNRYTALGSIPSTVGMGKETFRFGTWLDLSEKFLHCIV